MKAEQHAVYVVYFDGKPYATPRAAYFTESDARAAATRAARVIASRSYFSTRYTYESCAKDLRARFTIVAYGNLAEVVAQ